MWNERTERYSTVYTVICQKITNYLLRCQCYITIHHESKYPFNVCLSSRVTSSDINICHGSSQLPHLVNVNFSYLNSCTSTINYHTHLTFQSKNKSKYEKYIIGYIIKRANKLTILEAYNPTPACVLFQTIITVLTEEKLFQKQNNVIFSGDELFII